MHILENILYDYVDGILSPSEKEIAENHLLNCPSCKEKVDRINSIEADISSYYIDQDFLSEKMEKIYADIKPQPVIENKVNRFFTRKIPLGLAGAFTFSFAMIIVGAVRMFSPRSEDIVKVVPGSSPYASSSNIHPVSTREDMTISDHINAIKGLGYEVDETQDGHYIIYQK